MSSYKVYCDSCDAEYQIIGAALPKHCVYCSTELDETCISEEDEEFSDDEWDKLIEDIDEWDDK
jgi:hypothetical protein